MSTIRLRASLRTYLIVPFVAIIIVVMGLVGVLAFRNAQHAVNDLGQQLRHQLAARITQHLDSYLLIPASINNVTMDAAQRGELRPLNTASERYLWKLLQIFPTASWIYYGEAATGNFIGISRHEPEKGLWLVISDPTTGHEVYYYGTDAAGNRTGITNKEPGKYDPRQRPWYTTAVNAKGNYWSDIYPDWGTGRLVLSLATPTYDTHNTLLGVCTVDIFLDDISDFLRTLRAGQTGKIFIIERSGAIVATSTPEPPFRKPTGATEAQRLPMNASEDALIAATGNFLLTNNDLQAITGEQQLDFNIADQRQFVQIVPYRDGRGLDWLIVIVVPEADLMGQIEAGTQQTLALVIGAGLLAALIGGWMVNRITLPLIQLTRAADAIANGDLAQRVNIRSAGEVGVLTRAFNRMAADLAQAFDTLEVRVEERTTQLHAANQHLQQEKARLEQYNRQRELMATMTDLLQASMTINEASNVVSTYFKLLFPNRAGALYLFNAAGALEPIATWGNKPALATAFAVEDCFALQRSKPYRFAHELPNLPCTHLGQDIPADTLCLPLLAQGESLGVLHIAIQQVQAIDLMGNEEQRFIETIADSVALALANLRLRDQLRIQSIRDGLTGLFNRRYLDEMLPRELRRAERGNRALSVLMLDIDHFKQFNDTYGHAAGDLVLQRIAELMLASFRSSDIACRYGGEEFTVILPETALEDARNRAETFREATSHLLRQHNGRDLGSVTISVGVAVYPHHGATRDTLIKFADSAAYRAKECGRNRVEIAVPPRTIESRPENS